jgi:hypothetical protein
MAELVERATTLEPAWEHAKQPLLEEEERQRAIDDVIHLVSQPAFGSEPERDERRLNSLIAECKALRIGSADTKLREALIPWAVFIEGDDRNRDILRDISAEWERRQDAGKTELASDAPEAEGSLDSLTDELAAVREVTRGKRVLILGGINREENGQQIQAALETEVVVWPGTRPNETLDKYEDDIRNADIVALVSRYSRKDWKRAQDICAQEGRKYVQLTSGHGVSQVVRQFYKQLTPQAAAKA